MKTQKTTRAKSAKKETAKRNAENQVKAIEAVNVESVTSDALPVAANTDNGKVSSKDVLKAAGNLRAAVKEERRGAN